MMRAATLVAILSALMVSCGNADPDPTDISSDQEEFFSGSLMFRGHEDITRFGITYANNLMKSEFGVSNYFPTVAKGEACTSTAHTILLGDCATDDPDTTLTNYYGVPASSFGSDPDLQELHFLRNYAGSGVESGFAACDNETGWIIYLTQMAMLYWQDGDVAAAHYWMGHVLHAVQDSFGPAHTRRGGTLYRTLTDVCSYGRQVSGVCYHQLFDTRDTIWKSTFYCKVLDWNRSWSCLTPQAQSAAYATAGYLRVIGRHVKGGFAGDLEAKLTAWFQGGAVDSYSDYFHCETLP